MFRKANDRKSNLILNILSWVDFLKPQYCIFENVRGFLQYSLRARQDGPNRVRGGIPMGGLKLVIRGLTDMEYVFPVYRFPQLNENAIRLAIKYALVYSRLDTMGLLKPVLGFFSLQQNEDLNYPTYLNLPMISL